jgi:hypothetical protein
MPTIMGRSEAGLYLFVSRSSPMSGNCDLNRGAVTALNSSRAACGDAIAAAVETRVVAQASR